MESKRRYFLMIRRPERVTEIDSSARVDDEFTVGKGCRIGSNVRVIGRCDIGHDTLVEPNVTIYGPVRIGTGVYVGANSVIGFPLQRTIEAMRSGKRRDEDELTTTIGSDVTIRSNCTLYSSVEIENNVRFGHNCMVRERVKVGKSTLIGTNVVIDGDCTIGENVSIQTGVYIPTNTHIGDHVFLGPYCVLTNDLYMSRKQCSLKGPRIMRSASIGANSTIFPGVEVGEGAVVGAGSLVRDNVPAREVFVGIPAKRLKEVPLDWHIP